MRRCYYTLLEMVVVSALLVAVLGTAGVAWSRLALEPGATECAEELRRMAALCRRQAAARGQIMTVCWEQEHRIIRSGDDTLALPDDVKLELNGKQLDDDETLLKFFPDGGAAAVVIGLVSGEDQVELKVSPLTGTIVMYEEEP